MTGKHIHTGNPKGHWPRGKRRHTPDNWPALLRRLRRTLAAPVRGKRSRRVLAARLKVSDRAVRNWLAGIDVPDPRHVGRIREWIDN